MSKVLKALARGPKVVELLVLFFVVALLLVIFDMAIVGTKYGVHQVGVDTSPLDAILSFVASGGAVAILGLILVLLLASIVTAIREEE